MPAPGAPTYAAAAKVAAHTSLKDLIDGGAGAGTVKLYSSADVLLATITLTDPCGSVNGTTGQLTLTPASATTGVANGTAAYGTVSSSTPTVYFSADTQAGTAAVTGKFVINSLTIVSGGAVTMLSATFG
jgi:hypothetical protein